MPRSSVTRRSAGRSRPGPWVNMSASNRLVSPRCFSCSGWSISRSLHRCLSTAGCCSLCPFARWVSCSLCLGFRLCCRCLLAVRVAPVNLGFRPGFYTWSFGAVMGALIMGACVSILQYKDGLVHGWFWSVLTVFHTIRLWLDIAIFTVPTLHSTFEGYRTFPIKISKVKLSSSPIGLSI